MGKQKTEQKGTTVKTPSGPVHFIAGGKNDKPPDAATTPDYEGLAAAAIARNREGINNRTHALSGPHIGNRGRARKLGVKLGHGHV